MSTHPSNSGSPNDEIDLGQLFALIKQGFFGAFKVFLRAYRYIRKNSLILLILGIVGAALGYGLTKITSQKLKTDVIVLPNLESKRYLLNTIEEIKANIKAPNEAFFESLGIPVADIENFEIHIATLDKKSGKEMETELEYMEVLQAFENSDATTDIIRGILIDQNTDEQKITFMYKDPVSGPEIARKLIDYINDNSYFKNLVHTSNTNANTRIKLNDSIIGQLDLLIEGYTQKMKNSIPTSEGQVVVQEEDQLDIHEMLSLKNLLIMQSEAKRIELVKQEKPVRIINFGNTQPVKIPLFGKSMVLMPTLLITLFFVYGFLKYLNKKSDELLID